MDKLNLLTIADYDFEKLFKDKKYRYFNQGIYNMNIIGIRNTETNKCTNKFDDALVVIYKDEHGKEHRLAYAITTDPGSYYLTNPENSKGTAILVPGQYRGCWALGKHKNKYEALVQIKPVKVYRDNNKDDVYDFKSETIDKGVFGINFHRSSAYADPVYVNNYSAGCQVFKRFPDFRHFIKLCNNQKLLYGNSFTYTLIELKDLV